LQAGGASETDRLRLRRSQETEDGSQGRSIAAEWLKRVLAEYPEQTARILSQEKDRFRNPVGHALREGLPVLVEELLGEMNKDRILPALDGIVRIRAVQDFTPAQAVGFIFLLRPIVGQVPDLLHVQDRIDELALLAFDLYTKCREQLHEARVSEAKRRVFALERRARGQDLANDI
jgi:hypothetical protein